MQSFRWMAAVVLTWCSVSMAHAADTPACDLPFCDIPAKIQELRQHDQGYRFTVINPLRTRYKKSTDPRIFDNIEKFATAIRALSNELGDEDWMLREEDYLLNFALSGVLRFTPTYDSEVMLQRYRRINAEEIHFEVLNALRQVIPSLEEIPPLENLAAFGQGAEAYGHSQDESRFVLDEARALSRDANLRLAAIDPYHEGVYDIVLHYRDGSEVPHRMIILETTSDTGMLIGLLEKGSNELSYLYRNAAFSQDAFHIQGRSTYDGIASQIGLTLDKKQAKIEGWIRDVKTAENILITGKLFKSPRELVVSAKPPRQLEIKQLEGMYQGRFGTRRGYLIIKKISGIGIAAYFKSEDGIFEMKFQYGTFVRRTGVVSLVSVASESSTTKLDLAFTAESSVAPGSPARLKFTGFSFTMDGGTIFEASFDRVSDVDAEPGLVESLQQAGLL